MKTINLKYGLGLILILNLFSCRPNKFDISRVKNVSKLAALEVKLDKMVFARKETKVLTMFFGGITMGRASYIADTEATLLVGIDAGKLKAHDVTTSLGRISIKLPPIEILDFSYPAESFEENTSYVPTGNFNLKDKEEVFLNAEMEIRKMLPYLNLEKKAQEKTRQILIPILMEMGFEEIEIDYYSSTDFEEIPEETT
ncbi:MAG: DUF4230 domain-containing protein [Bacteroidota bacterium]